MAKAGYSYTENENTWLVREAAKQLKRDVLELAPLVRGGAHHPFTHVLSKAEMQRMTDLVTGQVQPDTPAELEMAQRVVQHQMALAATRAKLAADTATL